MKTFKARNVIRPVFAVIEILLLIWIVASFIDVNLHNNYFNPNYQQFADWNLFIMLFK